MLADAQQAKRVRTQWVMHRESSWNRAALQSLCAVHYHVRITDRSAAASLLRAAASGLRASLACHSKQGEGSAQKTVSSEKCSRHLLSDRRHVYAIYRKMAVFGLPFTNVRIAFTKKISDKSLIYK